ncbi:MAG: methyltransferase domain-containing protein [Clostridia bacterium]|nr:methyltransferase domain-containing protein [Clostridia bacterium]
MQENELKYYERIGNWDFSQIKCKTENLTIWDFYEQIKENTNEKSLCLDLGTGGGEKVLRNYPNVGMVIATDFSEEMIKTAKENEKRYANKKVKFTKMDNLEMTFPKETFDLISARHTIIDAKQIYDCLVTDGTVVIRGVDKKDCWEIKELFGRGQAYNDEIAISEKDYLDLKEAGFKNIVKVKILQNEYYQTEDDIMALLLKTPILNDFSEIKHGEFEHRTIVEKDLFDEYVKRYKTEKGILLKRVLYGIVAKKCN